MWLTILHIQTVHGYKAMHAKKASAQLGNLFSFCYWAVFSTDEKDQKEKEELSDLIGKVLRGPVNGEAGDHR